MIAWSHAYRSARKGDWERVGRDAQRFRERIDSLSSIIQPVLTHQHRDIIWNRLEKKNSPQL